MGSVSQPLLVAGAPFSIFPAQVHRTRNDHIQEEFLFILSLGLDFDKLCHINELLKEIICKLSKFLTSQGQNKVMRLLPWPILFYGQRNHHYLYGLGSWTYTFWFSFFLLLYVVILERKFNYATRLQTWTIFVTKRANFLSMLRLFGFVTCGLI